MIFICFFKYFDIKLRKDIFAKIGTMNYKHRNIVIKHQCYYRKWARRKKELRNKRRRDKRSYPENPRIIVDTHIWYLLGKNKEKFHKYRNKRLVPNFSNLYEFRNTLNLVTPKEESVRHALQIVMKLKKQINWTPAYVGIAQLANDFTFDPKVELASYLEFAERYVNGESIANSKEVQFRELHKKREESRQKGIDYINQCIETVKKTIRDKKEYRKKDTICDTIRFINLIVSQTMSGKYNIEKIEPSQIELLVKTLDQYLKAAVTGEDRLLDLNDWIDIETMGYVRPGDKFWTEEKRWKKYIKRAQCEHYLFNGQIN